MNLPLTLNASTVDLLAVLVPAAEELIYADDLYVPSNKRNSILKAAFLPSIGLQSEIRLSFLLKID